MYVQDVLILWGTASESIQFGYCEVDRAQCRFGMHESKVDPQRYEVITVGPKAGLDIS